ncbi:site-specific integrase [Bacillaceae bacterium Marseille-Q3522]|nr:site-specific integrase [Bacillaceae bacterium Marseille-Q3522]
MQETQLKKSDFQTEDRSELRDRVRSMRLWEYFEWFIKNEKIGKVAPVTLQKYNLTLNWIKRLAPELLVSDMESSRRNMQELVDRYGETHRKVTTFDFKNHVTSALNFAVEDGYIKSIARRGIEIRSVEKTWSTEKRANVKNQVKTFNMIEFNQFKYYLIFKLKEMLDKKPIYKPGALPARVSEQHYLMLYSIAIRTGARLSEILGFNREDITNDGIKINKTWNYKEIGDAGYLPTKNGSSIRTVVIDDALRDLLNKYWEFKERNSLHKDGTPFLLENGICPLNATVNDKLRRIEKDLNLPNISFHKLRHTYVSVLIDNGISEAVIAKQVGHSSTAMIQKVYGHLLKEREDRETAEIKGLMG